MRNLIYNTLTIIAIILMLAAVGCDQTVITAPPAPQQGCQWVEVAVEGVMMEGWVCPLLREMN